MLPKMEPQVVLLQCHAQGGFEVGDVHDILRLCPQSNVLIMAHHPDRNQVYKLLESGAKSFLLQECDQDEILSALKACAKGEKFFCDRVLDVLIQPSESGISGDSFKKNGYQERNLTPREAEILEYIGSGMSTSEIAQTLMLSTHTVHTHRKNIMRKLGVHKTSDLIRKAVRS